VIDADLFALDLMKKLVLDVENQMLYLKKFQYE
jgi:hypothetical protein